MGLSAGVYIKRANGSVMPALLNYPVAATTCKDA